MKIETYKEAKEYINKQIKFIYEPMPANLVGVEPIGILTKLEFFGVYDKNGEIINTWHAFIDVVNTIDGFIHHFETSDIWTIDSDEKTIRNYDIIKRIEAIEAEKQELIKIMGE